jgi:NAD(P)-dependent dehydrogenase (short-subunit alcohol dehydrogenase family)
LLEGDTALITGAASDAAEEALGSVSILVHSASPKRRENQTALAVTETEWDAMVTVGLRAGFVLGQAAGAHMKARNIKGRMLFITSLHAHTPRNLPHYSATKAGQTMLVKELARALGADGIRVNAIAPGAIPGGGFDADIATLKRMIPLGRTGTPEDVADNSHNSGIRCIGRPPNNDSRRRSENLVRGLSRIRVYAAGLRQDPNHWLYKPCDRRRPRCEA